MITDNLCKQWKTTMLHENKITISYTEYPLHNKVQPIHIIKS